MVGMIRIELMTSSMSTKRSTTELHALVASFDLAYVFSLSYFVKLFSY